LPKGSDGGGVEFSGILGGTGGDSKTQGRVVHIVDYDALMFGAIVAPAANVGLDDIASVQKGHFPVWFDPDLVSRVRGYDVKSSDVDAELARLGEFANAGSKREEVVSGDTGGKVCNGLFDIVDSGVLNAKHEPLTLGSRAVSDRLHQLVERAASVVG